MFLHWTPNVLALVLTKYPRGETKVDFGGPPMLFSLTEISEITDRQVMGVQALLHSRC